MTQRPCAGNRRDGARCRAFALPGTDRCMVHSPEHAATVQAARSRGGVAATRLRALEGRRKRLDSLPALVAFTSKVVQDTLDGTVEADIARAVLYGISIQRQLLEGDLVKRLAALERQLEHVANLRAV